MSEPTAAEDGAPDLAEDTLDPPGEPDISSAAIDESVAEPQTAPKQSAAEVSATHRSDITQYHLQEALHSHLATNHCPP